ncbi:MAG: pantetheine-phosphate adenylyltransferase, partial [Nitrospinae bacterium]|nr:pantetheine-phosphate adenylyltransferase [Nitrospinota bacterium]
MPKAAVYPGTFDPLTNGHIDLIRRARSLFEEVFVVVSQNPEKQPVFNTKERVALVKRAVGQIKGVHVESFSGLTVAYARKKGATSIIRGLRATSDFDYEFQMALTNRRLSKKVDTVFLMPSESHFYLSSRLIKEIAALKGDISRYV